MKKVETKDSNSNDEEDYWDRISICDGCNEETPDEDLIECPSSWEEVKDGIERNRWFCSDCCEEIFESEGCQSDVENCDRATEIMERKLSEYAKANNLKPFKSLEKVYSDEFEAFAVGTWNTSITKVNGKIIDNIAEDFEVFEGEDAVIVDMKGQKLCFSKETVDKIGKIFEALGCAKDGFLVLEKRKFLVVNGIGMWGIVPPFLENQIPYETERARFVEKLLEGHEFFKLSKKDGIVVVDFKKIGFEWAKLTDQQFQELCYDIFQSMNEIEEVQLTAGTADLGQDIRAIENVMTLTGPKKRKWTIQCKHFAERKVLPSDIADLPNAYSQLRFNVFCLMTSNFLSPGTDRMLEAWRNEPTYPFTTQTWDRKKIENFLKNKPDIYAKYFG